MSAQAAAILARCSPQTRPLAEGLRQLIYRTLPEVVEGAQPGWGTISYARNGVFCYIAPHEEWVNLGFWRGRELPDPMGLLQGAGKNLRHVAIRQPEQLASPALAQLLLAAYLLGGRVNRA